MPGFLSARTRWESVALTWVPNRQLRSDHSLHSLTLAFTHSPTPPLSLSLIRRVAVPLAAVADAIRALANRNRVVAEGAGACPVAAAMSGLCGAGAKKIVCVVSGGGIDAEVLSAILRGGDGAEAVDASPSSSSSDSLPARPARLARPAAWFAAAAAVVGVGMVGVGAMLVAKR